LGTAWQHDCQVKGAKDVAADSPAATLTAGAAEQSLREHRQGA